MAADTHQVRLGRDAVVEVPAALRATSEAAAHAVDSPVAVWQGDGLRLHLDRGPFADPLTGYEGRTGFGSSTERTGGRPARLVWFDRDDRHHVVAVHLDDATLLVEAEAAVPRDVLLAIARSLSLSQPAPE